MPNCTLFVQLLQNCSYTSEPIELKFVIVTTPQLFNQGLLVLVNLSLSLSLSLSVCVIKSPLRGSSENFSTCFIITCWRIRAQCLKILRCMQASIREVYHVTKYLSLTIIIKTILKISFGKFKTVKSCSNCCPEIMFERHLHKTL